MSTEPKVRDAHGSHLLAKGLFRNCENISYNQTRSKAQINNKLGQRFLRGNHTFKSKTYQHAGPLIHTQASSAPPDSTDMNQRLLYGIHTVKSKPNQITRTADCLKVQSKQMSRVGKRAARSDPLSATEGGQQTQQRRRIQNSCFRCLPGHCESLILFRLRSILENLHLRGKEAASDRG